MDHDPLPRPEGRLAFGSAGPLLGIEVLGVLIRLHQRRKPQLEDPRQHLLRRKAGDHRRHGGQQLTDGRVDLLDLAHLLGQPKDVLLAHLVGRRDGALPKTHPANPLNEPKLRTVAWRDERNGNAALSRTGGAAAAMRVHRRVIGKVVVDHMRDIVHIQPTGRHVGRHQNAHRLLAEFPHHAVALGLREIPVKGLRINAVMHQHLAQPLRVGARAAEHQPIHLRDEINHPPQRPVTVALGHGIGVVGNVRLGLVARAHRDLQRLRDVLPGDRLHLRRHRRGKQPHRGGVGDGLQDELQFLAEAQIEHLIRLVQHARADGFQAHGLPPKQIAQTPRRRHHHLRPALQFLNLLADRRPAITRHHAHLGQKLRETRQLLPNLKAQLPSGRKHQRLRQLVLPLHMRQQRKPIGTRLARSRRGEGHAIRRRLGQQRRDRLLLNRHRLGESQTLHRPQQRLRQSQILKLCHGASSL